DAGEFLDLLGPLGDAGFPVPESGDPILLVGGGVGSAPLLMCAKQAGVPVDAVLGFGTAAAVIMEQDFAPHCRTVAVTTDDGSYGQPGFVTAAAEKLIAENRYQAVLACGNMTMLKAVHALTERLDVPCWLSLDERMGCGIGACLVCAVKLRGEDHSEYYGHVCKQGPVFRREEVVF
ncbi:MAG: dihydroorotate dehydrogenase electron transfer subunit, partial [Clostridia bacterium]|nr:dihydroorotate dehydrogenase electron transfer subunit [Clostridia bacterium]